MNKEGLSQGKRLKKLNAVAIAQMKSLSGIESLDKLSNGRKKMTKTTTIKNLIRPILDKYDKLNLQNSPIYSQLKSCLKDEKWLGEVQKVLDQVEDADAIFYIVKEITKNRNDQRVEEMFAEFDVAKRLANTDFFGNFVEIKYLIKSNKERSPDFVTKDQIGQIIPVEVKLLSPQGLDEKKFFKKLIDKINNQALKQLQSFLSEQAFNTGMIFIWSRKPISLHNITYDKLRSYFKSKVPKQKFNLTVVCILSGLGLWDFNIGKNEQ